MVSFEDEATIKKAKRRFEDHVSKKSILPADLRKAAYCAALMTGNTETFNTLLRLYRETDLLEEKSRILGSLGATKDEDLLKHALEFSISEEVRLQETVVIMTSIQMSYKGRLLVWQFFKDNYKKLIDRYKNGLLLIRLIKAITKDFVTENYAREIKVFFEKHPTPSAEKSIKQSIESVILNAA
ncbi:puromycin-sensitive aminopeptidase-like [Phymastichus coffea]|uniref:puromycin-sensitive aminopeptidase-like n=1 Tax=Phymastichus coffea TaxID=108790 RepID=UPI00273B473B|nr:puromycin-sensitive aminopeptidase-like [Phymastichus coffea]